MPCLTPKYYMKGYQQVSYLLYMVHYSSDNWLETVTPETIQNTVVINLLCSNGFFLLVWYNKLGMVHCIYWGVIGYNFQIKLYFFSLKIIFVFANSVDSDEMLHNAAFHLGFQCLPKYTYIWVPSIQRVHTHALITSCKISVRYSDVLHLPQKLYHQINEWKFKSSIIINYRNSYLKICSMTPKI